MKNNASFKNEDIQRLQKIHFEKTGVKLTTQEAIEMGIRIKNILSEILKPIPT